MQGDRHSACTNWLHPTPAVALVTEEGEGAATEGELGEAAEMEEKEKDEEKEEKESQEGDAAKGRALVEWGCCAWRLCLCVLGLN